MCAVERERKDDTLDWKNAVEEERRGDVVYVCM